MDRLGELEAEIMDRLWSSREPLTVRDVRDALATDRPRAYTTVMTVMDRLFHKGWLTRERAGRGYRYRPAVSRGQHTAALMEDILSASKERGFALLHFVESMPPEEYEMLRDAVLWHEGRRHRTGDGQ